MADDLIQIGHVGDSGILLYHDPKCGQTNDDGSTNIATLAGLSLSIKLTHVATGTKKTFPAAATPDNLKAMYIFQPGDLSLGGAWMEQLVAMNGPTVVLRTDAVEVLVGTSL